jgi:hypothetical protein
MRNITARIITVMFAISLTAAPTIAANSVSLVEVPIPAGTAINNPASSPSSGTLDGFRSYDLIATTDADWTTAAVLLTLSSGMIFQEGEGFGSNGVTLGQPSPAGFATLPSSEFDTYIYDPHGGAGFGGHAVDLGGDALQFDSAELDASWFSPGPDTADIGTFGIARFTWSGDTNGSLALGFTIAGVPGVLIGNYQIVNGSILAPEPASLTLLSLGGLMMLRRHRGRHVGEV